MNEIATPAASPGLTRWVETRWRLPLWLTLVGFPSVWAVWWHWWGPLAAWLSDDLMRLGDDRLSESLRFFI